MVGLSQDEINRYLARIGLTGPLPPTAETLATIQWAHLQTVPFEALDISPLNTPFTLDLEEVYAKVVDRHRGGFCFELNSLLAALLESLGFELTRHAGCITDGSNEHTDPFDHLTLNVTAPDDRSRRYVDVAAGRQNPPRPVPLGAISADGRFRTRMLDDHWHLEKRSDGASWIPQIAWGTEFRQVADFQSRCSYFQNDPSSGFKSGPLCTLMTPDGRVTISAWTLITTVGDQRTEEVIQSEVDLRSILKEIFGIEIDFAAWWEETQP